MCNSSVPILNSKDNFLHLLDIWVEHAWIHAIDRAFVKFLNECEPETHILTLLAALLTSYQLRQGHACLDLIRLLNDPDRFLKLPPEGRLFSSEIILPSTLLAAIEKERWLTVLEESSLIESTRCNSNTSSNQPIVLNQYRLYLRRYWNYERDVESALRLRLKSKPIIIQDLSTYLNIIFNQASKDFTTNWQKIACAICSRGRFSIITGGPGTGKTTVVIRLIAVLQMATIRTEKPPLLIHLVAPTGKAARRLEESVKTQIGKMNLPEDIRKNIPNNVSTVHRFLINSTSSSQPYKQNNLLNSDVFIIDEASMVDLEMMAKVLNTIPKSARLVLLGDKDQLASVRPGSILNDLCNSANEGWYTKETLRWIEKNTKEILSNTYTKETNHEINPLAQQIVMLRFTRRFSRDSGIERLARIVNKQQSTSARKILNSEDFSDISRYLVKDLNDRALECFFIGGNRSVSKGYAYYLNVLNTKRPALATPIEDAAWKIWAVNVLHAFSSFQILCTVRRGSWGVDEVNRKIERLLRLSNLIVNTQDWYEGRPVLVEKNDHYLGLMNGDIGIVFRVPVIGENGQPKMKLRVAFMCSKKENDVRFISPSRLNYVETVYAMTVHKSQGSEFSHTALILPDYLNPILTKELIYTGITRAKSFFTLIESSPIVFDRAILRKIDRSAGLLLNLS